MTNKKQLALEEIKSLEQKKEMKLFRISGNPDNIDRKDIICPYQNYRKTLAIDEIKTLKKKLHLYSDDNKYYVEKRIKELVKKYNITCGDIWEAT